MRVLLLTRYDRLGASSRVRSLQYLPFLEERGWQVNVLPLFSDEYLEGLYSRKSRWRPVLRGYWRRLAALARAQEYDLLWIEKELFPFLPAGIERLLAAAGVRYVVDYDDALFHRYDRHARPFVRALLGRKIDAVMRHAALVIAGNEYLAVRAKNAGARHVAILPTVVDLERYGTAQTAARDFLTVGWIGSPATSRYLRSIAPAIEQWTRNLNARVVAIGADAESLKDLPVEALPWSEETEVASIEAFDVGIMPLPDEPWERGKCGYKLIQYMACRRPVVASPVGVNTQIVRHGVNGFLAYGIDDWRDCMARLLTDGGIRHDMGAKGRELVESWYSLQVQAPRLEALMRGALR